MTLARTATEVPPRSRAGTLAASLALALVIGLPQGFPATAQTTPLGTAISTLSAGASTVSGTVSGDRSQRHVLQGPSRGTVVVRLVSPHPGVTVRFDGLRGVRATARGESAWWGEAPIGGRFMAIVRMDSTAARRGDSAAYTLRVEDPSQPSGPTGGPTGATSTNGAAGSTPIEPDAIEPDAPVLWITAGRNAGNTTPLHAGPGRGFPLVGSLPNGIQVRDQSRETGQDGAWRRITTPSTGWAHESDLRPAPELAR